MTKDGKFTFFELVSKVVVKKVNPHVLANEIIHLSKVAKVIQK